MKNVGFIGWRGMVGSVLMQRMQEEKDFRHFNSVLFSTSQIGIENPLSFISSPAVQDAFGVKKLAQMDILISCQGADYTAKIYPLLRKQGWRGYWIDAASTLRMQNDSVIALDPINKSVIENALMQGIKNYTGGNCTVSLMMMAIGQLLQKGLVEWISNMTYQAASGAGAKTVVELLQQMTFVTANYSDLLKNPAATVLALEKNVRNSLFSKELPTQTISVPLVANLLPWIDGEASSGQSLEEWKGQAETNKILQTKQTIPVDGICVRVGSLRCHSQALTIKLKEDIAITDIENIITNENPWVKIIVNNRHDSLTGLTPAAVSGNLTVAVGRLRKLTIGNKYLSLFTIGDQLLWGAAEPLRRVLNMVLEYCEK